MSGLRVGESRLLHLIGVRQKREIWSLLPSKREVKKEGGPHDVRQPLSSTQSKGCSWTRVEAQENLMKDKLAVLHCNMVWVNAERHHNVGDKQAFYISYFLTGEE